MFRKVILALALLIPTVAQAEWYEARSKHFIVYSDDSPERITEYTERLERFDQSLRQLTGTPDNALSPNLRVTVFMLNDVGAVQKLYGGSDNVAGFYSARASGPIAFSPRKTSGALSARTILQHEYGHSFMFSTWPSVVFSKWFVEGFAEFVGTAFYRPDGSVTFGAPPQYRSYGLLAVTQVPASQLLKLDPGKLDDMQTHVFYGRAWLLTHYAILGGHAKELGSYIQLSNEGKAAEASRVFGPPESLDNKLNNYAKRRSGAAVTLTKEQVPVGKIELRKLTPGEAATMPARMMSSRGVDDKKAQAVVALARRLAAPYPNDAAAQNELAEAEFDAKNYAAAEAAADRAIAADPRSIHALLYKGMAQVEIAKAAGETSPERWKAIRAWFLKANKLDVNYPEPLIQFYDSFEAAKQTPSANAEAGLLSAYVLAPFDLGLRFKAGRVLLRQKDVTSARVAFEPIAYAPHQTGPNLALDVVKAIDTGGVDAALKVIADAEAKRKATEEEAKKKKKD